MSAIEAKMGSIIAFIARAMKLKSVMLKSGKTFCKTTCTIDGCEGELHVRIVPHRNRHARAWCSACDLSLME